MNESVQTRAPRRDKTPSPERFLPIRLVAMDVDGVLTDGALTWSGPDTAGVLWETKRFHARDGLAISVALLAGLQIAWLTGRRSAIVEQRARELRVEELHQGARDKQVVLESLRVRLALEPTEIAYVGDDLNDLPAFEIAGVRIAVAEAASELIECADWVTRDRGGNGAVREVIEAILRVQDRWNSATRLYLKRLREEQSGSTGQ